MCTGWSRAWLNTKTYDLGRKQGLRGVREGKPEGWEEGIRMIKELEAGGKYRGRTHKWRGKCCKKQKGANALGSRVGKQG